MTTTDTEAVNAGKYRRYRIIAGSYADDGGPCGVQAIEDENGVMCYVTDAEQVITSLRSQLADANEALTIARDVGSAGRNDEVRELQKQSASFRNAFSIADDEAEHCKAMLLEVEKERDQAMAENGELRKVLGEHLKVFQSLHANYDCDTGANGAHPHHCRPCEAAALVTSTAATLATKAQGERT